MNPTKAFHNSTLQDISFPGWNKKGIEVSVLRDDLIHPYMSGNKWRKLKYNIEDFKKSGKKILLTFGGAYSNHLVATASASFEFGFRAIGIVRGEEIENPYLAFAKKQGMILHFISRQEYRMKHEPETYFKILEELKAKNSIDDVDAVFPLPEGGANQSALKGVSELIADVPKEFDWIVCACGTGATLAGISLKLNDRQKALGIPVLKGNGYLENEIERLGGMKKKITLNENYHFGGYAKTNVVLENFCNNFSSETKIPVEPVYTGKLFYAINDLINADYFKSGEKVTVLHSGGIFQFDD